MCVCVCVCACVCVCVCVLLTHAVDHELKYVDALREIEEVVLHLGKSRLSPPRALVYHLSWVFPPILTFVSGCDVLIM